MRRLVPLTAVAMVFAASPAAFGQVLYDNASSISNTIAPYGVVSNPGAGFSGGDLSALVAPDTTFGFTANTATAFRIADNFTVPAGFFWNLTGASFVGYTTGAVAPTLTGASIRIFNGDPSAGGTVIFGDTTTNFQTSAGFIGPTAVWRALSTTPTNNQRQVQFSNSTFSITLSPGTYWIDYALTSSTGAVFSPPIVVNGGGAVATGDALQFNGTAYVPMIDAGGATAKGIPFQLFGTQTPIPEPTSMALVGIGAVGFALRRWRKK